MQSETEVRLRPQPMTKQPPSPPRYNAIDEAISALKEGRVVIVVDARERENEGDFICAAETITPETVDFMLKYGRGVLCVPVSNEVADRLRLRPAVDSESNT